MDQEYSSPYPTYDITANIHQSPPIDLSLPFSDSWLADRTAIITGGASGFGAGFARRWARAGANVIIADINAEAGEALAADIRRESGGRGNAWFVQCNVTDWESQVALFKRAVELSPHGGIDTVVANAGIAGVDNFELPMGLDAEAPPRPNLKTIDVNLTGLLYTAHLAIFWLQRNAGSEASSPKATPWTQPRDRHLLLMGSMASLSPIPAQPLYAVTKHGVMGLFRTMRSTSFVHGIRVNILCPYFIDTPILPAPARVVLAGGGLGKAEDVVEAGTRMAADSRILGRSLYIGPKMGVVQDEKTGEYTLAAKKDPRKVSKAIWEAYAHDYDDSELFARNLTRLLNAFTRARGWGGWFLDIFKAVIFGFRSKRKNFLTN